MNLSVPDAQSVTTVRKTVSPRGQKSHKRRALSPAQCAVLPLAPIFAACQKRGLPILPENRTARLFAVNSYLNDLPGFDWIEGSFKELAADAAKIAVLSDAIESGSLTWGKPAAVAAIEPAVAAATEVPADDETGRNDDPWADWIEIYDSKTYFHNGVEIPEI